MEGRKSVIFITGLCPEKCFYCPLSPARKNVDVMYVNEIRVSVNNDALLEIIASGSFGAGITGGDPLIKLETTVSLIRALKDYFGSKFHIHLYTTGLLLKRETMEKLNNAGLDEIRIHITGRHSWKALQVALKYPLSVGIENPAIPGEEKKLIEILERADKLGVEFVNLNELEISEGNYYSLKLRGMRPKQDGIGVVGSEETAKTVLDWALKHGISTAVHYCPAVFKDRHQFRRRMMLRALNTRRVFESLGDATVVWARIIGCNRDVIKKLLLSGLAFKQGPYIMTRPELAKHLNCRTEIIEAFPTNPRKILNITSTMQ